MLTSFDERERGKEHSPRCAPSVGCSDPPCCPHSNGPAGRLTGECIRNGTLPWWPPSTKRNEADRKLSTPNRAPKIWRGIATLFGPRSTGYRALAADGEPLSITATELAEVLGLEPNPSPRRHSEVFNGLLGGALGVLTC